MRLLTTAIPPIIVAAVMLGAIGPAVGDAPGPAPSGRDPELAREPSWSVPPLADVQRRVDDWLAGERVAEDLAGMRAAIARIWERLAGAGEKGDRLDAVMEIMAVVDPRAATMQGLPAEGPAAIEAALAWLDSPATADLERDTVKLWLGRELVRRERFDEALVALEPLAVGSSLDPATLLFCRGCCQHWLVQRDAAVESFERLLEREASLPLRYARLARLLRADIATVEADSLDHIGRRMRDIRRRLDLGRAGEQTRRVQRGVVESLDRLIAQLEQQQQAAAGAAGAGGGQGGGTGRPMDDSRIAGGRHTGTGQVESRDIGDGSGWGDLPPHEREAALQQIGRDYPAFYREAIEEYFKRLATGEEGGP